MNTILTGKNKNIVLVKSPELLITDLQSALDLAMTISYELQVYNIILPKSCISENFFILSTKLAGDILQKYINYGVKLAVVGNFSVYSSKALHDFIYESNHGKDFFFVSSDGEAVEKFESSMVDDKITKKGMEQSLF